MIRYNCYLLVLFLLLVGCVSAKDEMTYIIHLSDREIDYKSEIIENRSAADTIHIYSDTLYTVYSNEEQKCFLIQAGSGSNISGIVYLFFSKNKYEVLKQSFDPYTIFNIDISFHDINKKPPKEVVTLWTHEGDTYYITVDQVTENFQINNIFTAKDLGVPWIRNGQQMYARNDSLILSCCCSCE